jgi:hypothetical protein
MKARSWRLTVAPTGRSPSLSIGRTLTLSFFKGIGGARFDPATAMVAIDRRRSV